MMWWNECQDAKRWRAKVCCEREREREWELSCKWFRWIATAFALDSKWAWDVEHFKRMRNEPPDMLKNDEMPLAEALLFNDFWMKWMKIDDVPTLYVYDDVSNVTSIAVSRTFFFITPVYGACELLVHLEVVVVVVFFFFVFFMVVVGVTAILRVVRYGFSWLCLLATRSSLSLTRMWLREREKETGPSWLNFQSFIFLAMSIWNGKVWNIQSTIDQIGRGC